MMKCPTCEHVNESNAKFCVECGSKLDSSPAISNLSASSKPTSNTAYSGARLLLNSTGSIFRIGDIAIIGREDVTLHIDLEDYPEGKYVSHRHAQITRVKDSYYIEDLGSSNYTWVNQRKLVKGQTEPLKEGDIIRFGKVELTFHEG